MDALSEPQPGFTLPNVRVEKAELQMQQTGEGLPVAQKHEFIAVDAARGLAAGIVLIHHLTVFFPDAFTTLLGYDTLAARGLGLLSDLNTEAVMLFFVVSGFCIRSSSLRSDFARWDDVVYYGRRRFARIVPLYWFALAFTGLTGATLGLTADHAFSFETLVGNLSFLQSSDSSRGNWFVPYGLNGPLWSISYEVFYYVLFPIALIAERGFRIRSATASLAVAYVFSLGAFIAYNLAPNPIMLFATYYCVWRVGVCAFDVLHKARGLRVTLAITISTTIILSVLIAWHASANLSNIRSGTIIAIIWIAVQSWPNAYAIANSRPLSNVIGVLARLGGISYSLYLLHHPLLRLVSTFWGDTVGALFCATGAALVFAALAERGGLHVKFWVLHFRSVSAPT
jgi:peptidoglycan/LPS O-acetylase OafA/YrhL